MVLSFKPHLAPIKAAVIPLKRNDENLVETASKLKLELQKTKLGRVILENTGNIGKSYRKHDEIGTPLCITIDFDSIEKGTATIRDRDSMDQMTLNLSEIPDYYSQYIGT